MSEVNKECEELITEKKDEVNDLKFLCNFYGFNNEEDKLLTELKVFHSSFSLPKQEKKSTLCMMLNCFKENNLQFIFPLMCEFSKIYATLPVSTAVVESTFSKLKLIKSIHRSLCGQNRLSDLMLLSIEKDIPIDKEQVIDMFKHMANRRMLL